MNLILSTGVYRRLTAVILHFNELDVADSRKQLCQLIIIQ